MDNQRLQTQLQAYMRVAASDSRDTLQLGPFLCTFTAHTAMTFVNYAIPDDGARPTTTDIEALVMAFQERERTPRLEYITGLSPDVEPVLLKGGFSMEGTCPLMVYRGNAIEAALPDDFDIVVAQSDDDFLATLIAQYTAYEMQEIPAEDDVKRLRESAESGAIVVYARDSQGVPAGGGVCTIPHERVTELAGVGVVPTFRRRGIGAAITARLVAEAKAAGTELIFLSAADAEVERIYSRVGFETVSSVLHISKSS